MNTKNLTDIKVENKPPLLLIEDNIELQYAFKQILTMHGYDVTTADNGFEGLLRLKTLVKAGINPIVISDVIMDIMDGTELLAAIRNTPELEKTVVILMTASTRQVQAKFDVFLYKPFEINTLLNAIETKTIGGNHV